VIASRRKKNRAKEFFHRKKRAEKSLSLPAAAKQKKRPVSSFASPMPIPIPPNGAGAQQQYDAKLWDRAARLVLTHWNEFVDDSAMRTLERTEMFEPGQLQFYIQANLVYNQLWGIRDLVARIEAYCGMRGAEFVAGMTLRMDWSMMLTSYVAMKLHDFFAAYVHDQLRSNPFDAASGEEEHGGGRASAELFATIDRMVRRQYENEKQRQKVIVGAEFCRMMRDNVAIMRSLREHFGDDADDVDGAIDGMLTFTDRPTAIFMPMLVDCSAENAAFASCVGGNIWRQTGRRADYEALRYRADRSVKHYTMAIINATSSRCIWYLDSMGVPSSHRFWRQVLTAWTSSAEFRRRFHESDGDRSEYAFFSFGVKTSHQNNGKDCGLFAALYAQLWINTQHEAGGASNRASMQNIERHAKCTQRYMDVTFRPFIVKYMRFVQQLHAIKSEGGVLDGVLA
jgi:hypothetical protein